MPQITSGRLALATSSLALVVAIGGTGYAVATIGTAQLKDNAVTSAKIKNNNVTGKDVKEASLAKVPAAAAADNAAKIGGLTVSKVFYRSTTADVVTIFNSKGLKLTASCVSNDLSLLASTTKNDSDFYSVLTDMESAALIATDYESGQFDNVGTVDVLAGASEGDEDPGQVTFSFIALDGTTYIGNLAVDDDGVSGNSCTVAGTVTGG